MIRHFFLIPHPLRLLTTCALILSSILLTHRLAQAHTRTEIGPYTVIVGWVEEPVIVNERNALVIDVKEGEEPVIGLEGTLNIVVLYAGRTFRGNLTPSGEPGVYTAEILPTRRGQYEVQLVGTIGDLEVDETVTPEEVLTAAVLEFPESPPDPLALQERIDGLSAQLSTARNLAMGGIGAGVLGLLVGVVALVRRR